MNHPIESNEINRLFDQISRAFADAFCFVTVEHDFTKRQRFIGAVADEGWTYRDSPAYDTRYNDLDGKGFWLNVRRHGSRAESGARDMIAHCAVKVWRDTGITDLFVDNRFLQERDSGFTIRFDSTEADHVKGTLAYIGNAWVHPDYRRRGIAALLMAFCQLHLIEHYDVDYALGLIDDKAAEAGMGARAWRFHHHHRGIIAHWPGRGEFTSWLVYNNRPDMMEEIRRSVAQSTEGEVAALQASA